MSRLGEDCGIVREVRGRFEVDVFGHDEKLRSMRAGEAFVRFFDLKNGANFQVRSLGLDPHDKAVERFQFVGVEV